MAAAVAQPGRAAIRRCTTHPESIQRVRIFCGGHAEAAGDVGLTLSILSPVSRCAGSFKTPSCGRLVTLILWPSTVPPRASSGAQDDNGSMKRHSRICRINSSRFCGSAFSKRLLAVVIPARLTRVVMERETGHVGSGAAAGKCGGNSATRHSGSTSKPTDLTYVS